MEEPGSPHLERHLRAEDAYATQQTQRMGVPALQQQLLREMQARVRCARQDVLSFMMCICAHALTLSLVTPFM